MGGLPEEVTGHVRCPGHNQWARHWMYHQKPKVELGAKHRNKQCGENTFAKGEAV